MHRLHVDNRGDSKETAKSSTNKPWGGHEFDRKCWTGSTRQRGVACALGRIAAARAASAMSLKVRRGPRISLAALFLAASPGCSLIFTKGPQPELHPAPECTTSVAAPVTDTVWAIAGATLLGVGVAAVATSCAGGRGQFIVENYCGIDEAAGWGAVIAGTVVGALFTTSAVVGYQRTSACRSSLEPNALLPRPRASLLQASPERACMASGDAPRVCAGALLLPGGAGVVALGSLVEGELPRPNPPAPSTY